MRRSTFTLSAALLAALALAGPVAANDAVRWTDSHDLGNVFTCGVVEATTATIEGTAYFDAEGNWIKDILRFSYIATYTDPAGEMIDFTTRQIVTADPETISFIGQGIFVRAPGSGAVLLDVGRLTIDRSDGSTVFRSAQSLALDDPTVFDRYDAAICSLF
jgi:hypothetical protein